MRIYDYANQKEQKELIQDLATGKEYEGRYVIINPTDHCKGLRVALLGIDALQKVKNLQDAKKALLIKEPIDTGVILRIIDTATKGGTRSNEDKEKYFNIVLNLSKWYDVFTCVVSDAPLIFDFDLDLFVLGLKPKNDKEQDKYCDLWHNFTTGEITYTDFVKECEAELPPINE